VTAEEPLKVVPDAEPDPELLIVSALTTEPAEPVVFWLSVGTSAASIALKLGAPEVPLGPAKMKFADVEDAPVPPLAIGTMPVRLMSGVPPPEDARGAVAVTALTPAPPAVAEIVIVPFPLVTVTLVPAVIVAREKPPEALPIKS
jgi:hypothetical protein